MARDVTAPPDVRDRTAKMLRDAHVILEGDHFVYISGDHGDGWVDKDALVVDTKTIWGLSGHLAGMVRPLHAQAVCGPVTGGLIVSQWMAHSLEVPFTFAEHGEADRIGGELQPPFVLKRGFDKILRGKKVLVVDDIVNTGHSIRETVAAVRKAGGEVLAAAAYCTRGNVDAKALNVPEFYYLAETKIPSWPASSCHLCKEGVPINTEKAHGADYVREQQQRTAR